MAAPKRFFVEHISEEVTLTGEEFRHAKNVLRLAEGDEATLLDGGGLEYPAVIARVGKNDMLLHVLGKRISDKEPRRNAYLLVGALKGDKTELVVQKAVELGVSKIGVFSSRYCAAYMNENKLERLNKVAREAAKQCLRASVPEVVYFDTAGEAFASAADYESKLFACEFLEKSEGGIPADAESYALVVGSEGGFTEEEFACAKSVGFAGISLGKRILRAETAAISFLSVVMYLAGELQ
ncbi:MAG: 16S rRNA (uracil(1498)-N(3))-methyltransferase [Clostridia bacterium]|nr:16S rRNA (uracil(1498)-N(3))-methyltransferase [Clostridia bacterium]